MAIRKLFVGFSTQKVGSKKSYTISDIELVKRDLLNHLYTRLGERVMMPTYGTIIWDVLFEPFTEQTKNDIINDVKRIVKSEPRVELKSINVTNMEQGIKIDLELLFTPWDAVDTMSVSFDRRALERK